MLFCGLAEDGRADIQAFVQNSAYDLSTRSPHHDNSRRENVSCGSDITLLCPCCPMLGSADITSLHRFFDFITMSTLPRRKAQQDYRLVPCVEVYFHFLKVRFRLRNCRCVSGLLSFGCWFRGIVCNLFSFRKTVERIPAGQLSPTFGHSDLAAVTSPGLKIWLTILVINLILGHATCTQAIFDHNRNLNPPITAQ